MANAVPSFTPTPELRAYGRVWCPALDLVAAMGRDRADAEEMPAGALIAEAARLAGVGPWDAAVALAVIGSDLALLPDDAEPGPVDWDAALRRGRAAGPDARCPRGPEAQDALRQIALVVRDAPWAVRGVQAW